MSHRSCAIVRAARYHCSESAARPRGMSRARLLLMKSLLAAAIFLNFASISSRASAQEYAVPQAPPGYGQPAPVYTYGVGPPPSGSQYVLQTTPRQPEPTRPRSGFGLQLGQGFAGIWVSDSREGGSAASALGLALGGYVSPELAVFVRVSGVVGIVGEGDSALIGSFVALLQHWTSERWMVSGGLGVASLVSASNANGRESLSVLGRVGYAFSHWTHHSLMVVFEVTAALNSDARAIAPGISFEWQIH